MAKKIQLKIADHLLIPFGRPKWNIEKIKIAGVSTTATYIESDTPLVYIDRSKKKALRLRDFTEVFPEDFPDLPEQPEALKFIHEYIKKTCNLDTDFEKRFLDLYFAYCTSTGEPTKWELQHYKEKLPPPKDDRDWIFDALLPLPQAHLYLSDPLGENSSFVPNHMIKVDFAFWTGTEILAIEIDGSSHVGNESHIRKDRMLQRVGVPIFHILNAELLQHGQKVISRLLPAGITHYWKSAEGSFRCNPLSGIPF
jgi:hypothetical protein